MKNSTWGLISCSIGLLVVSMIFIIGKPEIFTFIVGGLSLGGFGFWIGQKIDESLIKSLKQLNEALKFENGRLRDKIKVGQALVRRTTK